jgi:hypothetical protein
MRRLAVPLVCVLSAATAAELRRHIFDAGDHVIIMDVRLFDSYAGERLVFRDDRNPRVEICLAGNGEAGDCPKRFVGAVVAVKWTVKRTRGKLHGDTSIREHVVVTAQSPDLPPRAPFDKTQVLKEGTISDLQAFGYDEAEIPEAERESERRRSKDRLWRHCRQELYLNHKTVPFAVINWRYTLDAIELVDVQARAVRRLPN